MRNRRPFTVASTFFSAPLLASLLGCSSGSPSASGSTITPDSLAVALATSFCNAEACCGTPGGTISDAGASDGGAAGSCTSSAGTTADGGASTCAQRATLSAEQQLALVSTAFNEGLLTIDPATTTACASAYQQSSCSELAGRDGPNVEAAVSNPACANLFVGYIPIGERCDMSAECVSGGYCLSQGTGQAVTSLLGSGSLGICFPFQGMSSPCNTTDDCQPPLTCSPTSLTCE